MTSTTIDINDPRLISDIPQPWQPPLTWEELALSRDHQDAAQTLADLGLLTKATNLCTCGKWFIPILEYSDHWARVGKVTCHHKFACRTCGGGKARAHRIFTVTPERFAAITADVTRTITLGIHHESPCATLDDYRARVKADKRYIKAMRRKFLHGRDVGYIMTVELDPRMQDVAFRIYYVGPILDNKDIRWCWQSIVGQRAYSNSRVAWEDPREALRWTLDASCHILMLPGAQRAHWEQAFQGYRLSTSCGVLRGIDLDEPQEDAPKDSVAPYGYCPCGCGGVVVKSVHRGAASLTNVSTRFRELSFGSLNDYVPYSRKVTDVLAEAYSIPPTVTPVAPSPPPW